MGRIHFQTIGSANIHTTKTGKKCIRLKLEKHVRRFLLDDDFSEKIYLFKNKFAEGFTVMCPIDEDFKNKETLKDVLDEANIILNDL